MRRLRWPRRSGTVARAGAALAVLCLVLAGILVLVPERTIEQILRALPGAAVFGITGAGFLAAFVIALYAIGLALPGGRQLTRFLHRYGAPRSSGRPCLQVLARRSAGAAAA